MPEGKRCQARTGFGQYQAHIDYQNLIPFLIRGKIIKRGFVKKKAA